jgi:outer membrane lipoprotein-sorting protein
MGRERSWHIKCGCSGSGKLPVKRVLQMSTLGLVLSFLLAHAAAQQSPMDKVIQKMDQAAANFHSTEASFVWDQYQKVVDETDSQKGKIYFRKNGGELQMAADVTDPSPEQVLFTDSKVQIYQPRIEQVTVYNTGKDKAAVEGFLVLGFGGSGKDMLKSFDVKYIGSEKIGDIDTDKLELTPKSPKLKNNVDRILLWIDRARGVSVQQQFFTPGGDYKLAKYTDVKVNEKFPDGAFKLHTTSKTKTVSPQG